MSLTVASRSRVASTSTSPRRRARFAGLALCVAIVAVTSTACQISWSAGKTHGAIIEPTAARASVGIWRAPTRLLYGVQRGMGVNKVQQYLCDYGHFPAVTIAVGSRSMSADVISHRWCGYVNGDDADLRGALDDAQAGSRDDCLALTLISHGMYIKNWTHKSGGCRTGAI